MYKLRVDVDTEPDAMRQPVNMDDIATITAYIANSFCADDVEIRPVAMKKTLHTVGTLVIHQEEKSLTILRFYMSDLTRQMYDLSEYKSLVYDLLSNNERGCVFIEVDDGEMMGYECRVILGKIGMERLKYPVELRPSFRLNPHFNFLTYLHTIIDRLQRYDMDELYRQTAPVNVMSDNYAEQFYMSIPGFGRQLGAKVYEKYPTIVSLLWVEDDKIKFKPNWNIGISGIGRTKKLRLQRAIMGERKTIQKGLDAFE